MKNNNILLVSIIILGFILRTYGISWDQGFHLHPDERMLIMVAERVHFFDQLNPDFFNYGSLPIYLLKGTTQLIDALFKTHLSNYDGMLYAGRMLSVFFDLLTIFLIYKITRLLFYKTISQASTFYILPSFFYAIAFFPIQNSHFFISDVFLTTFTTLLIYLILRYLNYHIECGRTQIGIRWVVLIGGVFGAMVATKFTAIVFLPIIIGIIFWKTTKEFNPEAEQVRFRAGNLATSLITFHFSLLTFNFLFMPYAFLEHKRFFSDVLAQIKMNSDPYIFPYTLQYVGTIPYLYYLKNIFLWGLGPTISVLSLIGLASFVYQILKIKYQIFISNIKNNKYLIFNMYILFFIFYFLYFIIIGRSAVKFMRYMLPIYPFLAIMAGFGLYQISNIKYQKHIANIKYILLYGLLTLQTLWTLMFINIYSQSHTRIAATEWILKNIPTGSTLAVEHWDDRVPLFDNGRYKYVELPLYELPDDSNKWANLINPRIEQADYIIIASNRLYVPLQKLNDCSKYKSCYPKTAEYYRRLFGEENVILGTPTLRRGTPESDLSAEASAKADSGQARMTNSSVRFKKVAEFAVYPKLEIGNWKLEIRDEVADESFTVYDHPKVMVFRKN